MKIAFLVERPTQFEAPFYRFAARDRLKIVPGKKWKRRWPACWSPAMRSATTWRAASRWSSSSRPRTKACPTRSLTMSNEYELARDNRTIGKFQLTGIPPAPRVPPSASGPSSTSSQMTLSPKYRSLLRVGVGITLAFIYIPLLVIAIYAFNASNVLEWPPPGLTLSWFPKAFESPSVHEALSIIINRGEY